MTEYQQTHLQNGAPYIISMINTKSKPKVKEVTVVKDVNVMSNFKSPKLLV